MKPDASKFLAWRGTALICLLLAGCTITVFWPLHVSEFIIYDDPTMIYQNPIVAAGWTRQGFLWGLTTQYFDYWHPLTWWSYMTDSQLFGLNAHRFHLMSLGFHVLNALVLFAAFSELTGMRMRSGIVAALFALHPMHVESVAWLAERKDLLSTLFWTVSLWAYARYVRMSRAKNDRSELFYRSSLFFFLCGIMSKPMVVTLPFVLLLLDYWPLNRFVAADPIASDGHLADRISRRNHWTATLWVLVKEKTPFFGFSLFSCIITYSGMNTAHNVVSAEIVPWSLRLSNVPVSYARYLGRLFWPTRMSVFYPLPNHWEIWQVAVSILAILIISMVVLLRVRQAPYLVVGWLMFLGMVVPTISLVPVGYQSMADRFTYLPYIGLFVAGVWAAAEVASHWRFHTALLAAGTALALLSCSIITRIQVGYWRNDLTLWPHCLAVTSENFTAHSNYGLALQKAGQINDAIAQYREAWRIHPRFLEANNNLGRGLAAAGNFKEATNYFTMAVELDPNSSDTHGNLGAALYELGDFPGAEAECTKSIQLNSWDFRSLVCLGRSLGQENKSDDAVHYLSEALRIQPASPEAHYYLGCEYLEHGMMEEAISNFNEAVSLKPSFAEARRELGAALARRTTPTPVK